jgi:flagellar motor switch protein FliN/FliY
MNELTQEQIDAMLRNEDIHVESEEEKIQRIVEETQEADVTNPQDSDETPTSAVAQSKDEDIEEITENISEYLTSDEIDALGEIGNICMGTSATTMSSILGHRVIITTPKVQLFRPENALAAYRCPFLAVSVGYQDGLEGKNLLILKDVDAAVITDVMMGGDGNIDKENIVLTEIHLSAISEIMNQMIGSSATALSNMLGRPINITPPQAQNIEVGGGIGGMLEGSPLLVRTSFDMEIEGILHSKLLQMMPLDMALNLARTQLNPPSEPGPEPDPKPAAKTPPAAAPKPASMPAAPKRAAAPKPQSEPRQMVSVQEAACEDFGDDPQSGTVDIGNLELINDIPLQVTVELGRTHKSLQEVMNFGVGTIIMLDRLAGEPVDVIVNGKRIAKGEVVVIDENYGVRINEIFSANKA